MRRSEVHAAESVACLNRALHRLKDIWEEIGIPEDQRMQRTAVVSKHIKGLLDMMIAEEESLRKRLMSSIESCRRELHNLCTELALAPFEEEEGSTILQLEKDLRTRLEVLMKQKSQRVQELRKQDQELCDVMGSTPYCINMDLVPSLGQLESYRAHLDSLAKEKARRHAEFVGLRRQIVLRLDDLERLPGSSLERDVVCEDQDAFCLSTDNMAALRRLLSQLEQCKAEQEVRCSAQRSKIQELWERLQVPQEQREALAPHMVSSKKTNMDALRAELGRLEQLKVQNMQHVVEGIRAEVALFWERCYYGPEQRRSFLPYYDDELTEELLSLHEAEALRLKKQYEAHQDLFEGVTRWQDSWTLFLELEKKTTDPSRFNNRGGNLLKEEKQRAELQKSLPKLEKSLKAQVEVWEAEQGQDFLVHGRSFLELVQDQWDARHMEKEQEKHERLLKKSKQTEEDMLYGTAVRTPSKRRLAGTPTPGKARKLNTTSSTASNSTLRSALGGTICPSPARPPLSASRLGSGLRASGRGRIPRTLDRNKENVSHVGGAAPAAARLLASPHPNISITSVASTYSEFAREISRAKLHVKTGHLNSTVTHL